MPEEIDIPKYAPAAPSINENCLSTRFEYGLNIINPPANGGGEGLPVEVTAGHSMLVTDNSDDEKWSHEVAYSAYEEVAVALSIVTKELTVVKTNPILSGTVVDAVECDWSYNAARDGDIATQTIINTGAGSDPSLNASIREYDYSALTIQTDATVTITGDDGISNDNDVEVITFGNYLAVGVSDPSLLFLLPENLQAVFDALATKTVKTTQAGHNFDAFGTSTEYMVICHPVSFGETIFTKNNLPGGYKRIYSVTRGGSPLLVDEVLGGDTENAISIDNGKNGHTEDYFFYMSDFPERAGDTPTILSKA